MNFLSRLLTTAGLAALVASSVTTVTAAATGPVPENATTARSATAEQTVQSRLAGLDFRGMSLEALRGVVDGVVGDLADRPDMTPEFAASLLAQSLISRMAAVGPMSPSIAESVQAVIAASVIDNFRRRGWPVDPPRVVQAAAVGGAFTGSVSRSPGSGRSASRDLGTVDRDDVSAY
jgi:hypothetical protein